MKLVFDTLKYENAELAKQMKILWDNIGASLIGCGVTRIDQIGIKINPQMNIPIQTSYDENQLEDTILEVLKSGYIYNTQILRKAHIFPSPACS
ncbi:nucleotide exchange factor GrpE [Fusibacter ferrireducens]|uniref:Nucleotide exchange factor GrpE n=1 Tax=Fusibacter ferrireducens TaxID=2785058 RepID=A0ABR9ZXG0_9FIRM|nr:nucleotide exchange factor GrpE [Fusibacter ferrireducens]MBF4695154.1 nucleotide exchange factor GrpE [Fusibacter ferrireducens]